MEEKNKQAAEAQEWLLPEQIEIIETSDPKVMLEKWLAEPVLRKWTEDFVDESTGELVSVERTEPIITTGTYCSQDIVQLITFHLQAGDIETVKVSERPPLNKRTDLLTMNYIVSVGSMLPQTEYIYVAGVQTPEEAAKVVTDYCKVYSSPNIVGDFTVNDCQLTPIIYLYDHQARERAKILEPRTRLLEYVEDGTPRPAFTETLRFWNVNITKWSFSAWEGWKPYKQTICTEAYDMHQSIDIVEQWAKRLMEGTDIESWIVDVTKVGKSKITHVIPYTYLKLWRSKNPIKKEGGER